jgi:hypothetical protein
MSGLCSKHRGHDPECDQCAALDRAKAAFAALSPEEQTAHCRAQRISWVRGELRLQYPEMTHEEATRWAEEAVATVEAER